MTDRPTPSQLGNYLKDRRKRLDPNAFGLTVARRRTPGLRREEVAHRANISVTWYTWLEQGRGGAPSAEVLDKISEALLLTDVEREHLFLLALGRPPEINYRFTDGISPRLQRVLDGMSHSPALIKTVTWDVVAWNRAAAEVFIDYGSLAIEQRNIMRLMFCDSRVKASQSDWQEIARFIVSVFRADIARTGAAKSVEPFVREMCRLSPEFDSMWRGNAVSNYGEGIKHVVNPANGEQLSLEYSAFLVDGRPDLTMLVYNPLTKMPHSP